MDALSLISQEHSNIWRLAITVDHVASEIEAGAAVEQPFFNAVFDYLEQFVGRSHHPREDDYLYRLLRLRCPQVTAEIDRLQAEHRQDLTKLAALRAQVAAAAQGQLSGGQLAAALNDYTTLLKTHILTEEKSVLPLARSVFTTADWTEIKQAFQSSDDPMFSDKSRAEFRQLYHRVANLAPESVGLGSSSVGTLQPLPERSKAEVQLRVQGMESCYGRIKALKGISIEVRRGETVALVGANGAGKTTFLRTLSGVQPMSAGSIYFKGQDISRLRSDKRTRCGICQSPEGRQVFGPLSIEDNLALGAYTQPRKQVPGDMEKIFTMFPILKERRAQSAGTLSGGQQQMLAIGRALMGRPSLLLLDEPSMGLAPMLVEEVFNVIRMLKSKGMTILLVEQNAFAALAIADRGYVLETGTVTLSGTGQELINNEQVRAAYLGM
ncbi:MAG: ABC transporter [Comamonadaceae bacterium CG12_big_fil_rev_8_21_14_0_65_59_15]|nr:MAG: ABC transporter [Comamonadaceae bacterium CG12_big_fil_rev_8_21_14_0_65_59_15]